MRFSRTSSAKWLAILSVVAVVGLASLTSVSQAGMLASTTHAYFDGVTNWKGSLNVDVSFGTQVLKGDIDFAVFPPHKFELFLNGNGIALPAWLAAADAAHEMVYAYHMFGSGTNNGLTLVAPTASVAGVSNFSVGVGSNLAGYTRGSLSPSVINFQPANTRTPSSMSDQGSQMRWFYTGTGVKISSDGAAGSATDYMSGLMVFTSPNKPIWGAVTATAGTLNYSQPAQPAIVPTIGTVIFIPEPASIVLFGLGACWIVGGAFVRRRAS